MRRAGWLAAALLLAACTPAPAPQGGFVETLLETTGPGDPWAKAVGDLDGDGKPDIVIGWHESAVPSLLDRVWYKLNRTARENPPHGLLAWYGADGKKHVVSDRFNIRTDAEVADIDGDGRNDIVAVTDQGVVWFHNPDWTPTIVDTRSLHDVEVADLDGDGKPDIVARGQHLFGHANGDRLQFYRQVSPQQWQAAEVKLRSGGPLEFGGEGLKIADVDGDGRPDVLVNQAYLRNPGTGADPNTWELVPYCPDWKWPHANLDVVDVNGDGRPDILMAPAEPAKMDYRLSWCEAPAKPGEPWKEHVIDAKVETVMHGVAGGDLDGDGRFAVVTASMHVAQGTKDVVVYRPQPDGSWSRTVVGTAGAHGIKLADVDKDGDLDIVGANFSGPDQRVRLWVNQSTTRTAAGWKRHVVDDQRPWQSVFVFAADLDGDGKPDLVSGSRWYTNPGRADGRWVPHTIGPGANNVALVRDFDGDGKPDLLVSEWNGIPDWTWKGRIRRVLKLHTDGRPGQLLFARNDGRGGFQIIDNVEPGAGDFLQGTSVLPDAGGMGIALSWHQTDVGLQQLRVPQKPATERWARTPLSAVTQNEELTTIDIDRDGLPDLVLGTQWLRQAPAGTWTAYPIRVPVGVPDRHRVGDIDGDGRPDVVVGDKAISKRGKLAWYSAGPDPTQPWTEHVIGWFTGPMSISLADMDGDGDLDVVVGEHDLRNPSSARLLWIENRTGDGRTWVPHVIHTGDEHHDGALVVDVDGDGDLDVVSIGWGHGKLLLYENLARQPR